MLWCNKEGTGVDCNFIKKFKLEKRVCCSVRSVHGWNENIKILTSINTDTPANSVYVFLRRAFFLVQIPWVNPMTMSG